MTSSESYNVESACILHGNAYGISFSSPTYSSQIESIHIIFIHRNRSISHTNHTKITAIFGGVRLTDCDQYLGAAAPSGLVTTRHDQEIILVYMLANSLCIFASISSCTSLIWTPNGHACNFFIFVMLAFFNVWIDYGVE